MATNRVLQDLYAQILHSEEQVKERNAKFKAVNEEIASIQSKTAELRDELKSHKGNLAIQNNKVAEQELQLKWLNEKERIMSSQKQHLLETKLELQKKLRYAQEKRQCEREKFIAQCEEFSSMYDLTGEGKRRRESFKRQKLEETIKNTEKLQKEVNGIHKLKNEIDVLEQKKQNILNKIKKLEFEQNDADKMNRAEKDNAERLRQERQRLSEKLKNDPDLQRLTAELKECKEEGLSLQGINDAMDQELDELRQQYYQKQLSKQREQRERQLHEHQPSRQKLQTQQRQYTSQSISRSKDSNSPGVRRVAEQTRGNRIQRPLFVDPEKHKK